MSETFTPNLLAILPKNSPYLTLYINFESIEYKSGNGFSLFSNCALEKTIELLFFHIELVNNIDRQSQFILHLLQEQYCECMKGLT